MRKRYTHVFGWFFLFSCIICSPAYQAAFAQSYTAAPVPLDSEIELIDITYAYNPASQTLNKTYTLKNISGKTLQSPQLVTLFLWSNNVSSSDWVPMAFDGAGTFSNAEQSATIANNDGTITWSTAVTPDTLASTAQFPDLPVQTSQAGIAYPYWHIPGYLLEWPDGVTASIPVEFSNVQNSNWIQNMVWIVYLDNSGPVLVQLSSFTAMPGDGSVALVWKTASEIKNAGFNLYRREQGQLEPLKINTALIPARGTPTAGADYEFVDTGVTNGVRYYYYLEDVDLSGVTTMHGPVKATPHWLYSLFHR